MSIPSIITTFRVIINIIEQPTEVDEDGPWSVLGNQVALAFSEGEQMEE
jgi:hypothetical protein